MALEDKVEFCWTYSRNTDMLDCSLLTMTPPPVSCGKGGRRRTTTLTRSEGRAIRLRLTALTGQLLPDSQMPLLQGEPTALGLGINGTCGTSWGPLTS